MAFNYPDIMASPKTVLITAGWTGDEKGRTKLSLGLDSEGVTLEGMFLRLTANRTMPDQKVMCQVEHRISANYVEPLARIRVATTAGTQKQQPWAR